MQVHETFYFSILHRVAEWHQGLAVSKPMQGAVKDKGKSKKKVKKDSRE